MSAKEDILRALRAAGPPTMPLPEIRSDAPRWLDRPARFAEALAAVAGTCVRARDEAALAAEVRALAERLSARRIVSAVGWIPGERLDAVADPHELEGVDLAVLPGAFGVAENGAVWVPGAPLRHRGIFVVTQHLALVVAAGALVNDMHEAVERLAPLGPGYGTFIAGPSKTADIEQALVIGAHGARSCTVFLLG